jgi:hypothetical protein
MRIDSITSPGSPRSAYHPLRTRIMRPYATAISILRRS